MKDNTLQISAFKDIVFFILEPIKNNLGIHVNYVKNAEEAHHDLRDHRSDIVFMSYDDTLSMALQDKYTDIAAIMPVHGGILDLCGTIDLKKDVIITGIDTPTGYARLLKSYLKHIYPQDFDKFDWVLAGATNIRFEKLKECSLDITLLNPPFSYDPIITKIMNMYDFISEYQGVVMNVNQSNLQDPSQRVKIKNFIHNFHQRITGLKNDSEKSISELASFYRISLSEAKLIYARLWQPDGLSQTSRFEEMRLVHTENIFSQDTGIKIPAKRTWLY